MGIQQEASGRKAGMEGVFPVRGLAAVYVFVTGIYGSVIGAEDERRNLYVWIDRRKRGWCRLTAQAAPVFLAAVSALAATWLGEENFSGISGLAAEAWNHDLLMGLAVVLFSRLLGLMWKKSGNSLLSDSVFSYGKFDLLSCFGRYQQVFSGSRVAGTVVSALVLPAVFLGEILP